MFENERVTTTLKEGERRARTDKSQRKERKQGEENERRDQEQIQDGEYLSAGQGRLVSRRVRDAHEVEAKPATA